jgi:hypothetical protein
VTQQSATDLVVDALAIARLTRLVQDDEVWPVKEGREAFERWADDSRWADLASCPWCASWWIALLVIAARHRWPRAWSLVSRALAASYLTGYLAEKT